MNTITTRCARMCASFFSIKSARNLGTTKLRYNERNLPAMLTKSLIRMKAISLNMSIVKSTGTAIQGTAAGELYNGIAIFDLGEPGK